MKLPVWSELESWDAALGAEPESDKYGIANAITWAAQSEDGWEKSLELERVGGKLLTLPAGEFKKMDE